MSKSKKGSIMSLSVDSEIQDKMKVVAKKRNISVSKLVRDLADKFLNEEDNVDMVVLKIPKILRNDEVKLREWIDQRKELVTRTLISLKDSQ
jgi:predicted DNA-binding ribbon-helix-helix protein